MARGAKLIAEIEVAMADGMQPVMVRAGAVRLRVLADRGGTPNASSVRASGRLVLEWRSERSGLQGVSVQQVAKALGRFLQRLIGRSFRSCGAAGESRGAPVE